ncbi:MAG: aminopeptidase P family N-terminal domain-containing protein, partial [Paracoccaceae bacterium]|nr:aminopeptidase P family N-terminal domain-containing protein [Paracoccaceae bacterium]
MSFQSFEATTRPEDGPPRLARLRAKMAEVGVEAVLVPRADAHQGEYVAPCDERLAWLTGFTGSAGFAAVTAQEAALFVDGRYTVQARNQVDTDHFTPVPWPKTKLADWLKARLGEGAKVGFDPWLHTVEATKTLGDDLEAAGIEPFPGDNLIDAIWEDRPARPAAPLTIYPAALAGATATEKIAGVAETLERAGQSAAVLTLPDSIAWLLNIRGGDIPRIPIAHAFALVHATGAVDLFTDAAVDEAVRVHLGPAVTLHPYAGLLDRFETLAGKVRV